MNTTQHGDYYWYGTTIFLSGGGEAPLHVLLQILLFFVVLLTPKKIRMVRSNFARQHLTPYGMVPYHTTTIHIIYKFFCCSGSGICFLACKPFFKKKQTLAINKYIGINNQFSDNQTCRGA
jgi:hypothetical protein